MQGSQLILRGLVRVTAVFALLLALTIQAHASTSAKTRIRQAGTVAYAVGSTTNGTGFLAAFDAQTGTVFKRLAMGERWQAPDLLVTPAGNGLYLLYGSSKARAPVLSRLDTRSWTTKARRTLPDAALYTVTGSSTQLLSPDGTRLFVYSFDGLRGGHAYWLATLDPRSLALLPARVALGACGGAQFALAQGQLVALCFDSNDLYFIDPRTAAVSAIVASSAVQPYYPAGPAAGMVVSPDQGTLYVVTNDLRIIAVDTTTHQIVRQVTTWQQAAQTVPPLNAVALAARGQQLVVGTRAVPRDETSTFTILAFSLPSVSLLHTRTLPHSTSFVATPTGDLYLFQIGTEPASANDWRVRRLSADLAQMTVLAQFAGPLYHVVFAPGPGR